MAKSHSGHHHPTSEQGTPTYIIMSVLFTIVIFALEGIKSTISLMETDHQTQSTMLGFIGLGLSLCFFWRRLHDSLFKALTALFFTASLWAYLVAMITLPLLATGEDVNSRLQLFHQCGLGGLVISGFSLMAALLYHQKPVPALLMTTLAGFLVGFGSLYPLLRPSSISIQQEFSIENRSNLRNKKAGHLEEEAQGSKDHEEGLANHKADSNDEVIAQAPIKSKRSQDGSTQSKMKLSAHASAPNEDEDASIELVQKALLNESEDDADTAEHAPKTLSAAQKAKLGRHDIKSTKARTNASADGRPAAKSKMALSAKAFTQGPHWEYSGEAGPDRWGQLTREFKTCSAGLEQSPINILSTWPTRDAIELDYKPSTFQVVDNGHTVQVNVERGSFAAIAGLRYELKQIHFHAPSEHLVDYRPYQMEVHFVHANIKGQLAVIAAFINPGKSHAEYQRVWDYMPQKPYEPIKPYNVTLDIRSLLPSSLTAFHYPGSLTTPPCSENVNWNVLYTILKMSQEQIDSFKMKYKTNARPVQPLNYRKP